MKQLLTIMFVCGAAFAQTKSTTASTAKKSPAPTRNLLDPSTLKAKAPETYKVQFTTTQGIVLILVTRAWAPIGADRFYNLVRGKFFDGCTFFRVKSGFMAQFGVSPNPKVTAAWSNEKMMDEPVKQSNKRGFVTFAKSSLPNSRGTQLFINYGDNSRLDADGFAPIGEVIEGMDVADKFYDGYGLNPDPGQAMPQLGKAWTDAHLPKVDLINTAIIVPAVPPPAAATKSTTAKTPATKSTTTK
jgi:peptidyl-prolyl cis-trans isomerase A (cyclophilin A)